MNEKAIEAALHEARTYGIGATSDYNQKIILDAATRFAALPPRMLGALQGMHAFIAVMFGRGPDATIPETVDAPIGVPIKVGEIMREATAAIAKAEAMCAPPVAEPKAICCYVGAKPTFRCPDCPHDAPFLAEQETK